MKDGGEVRKGRCVERIQRRKNNDCRMTKAAKVEKNYSMERRKWRRRNKKIKNVEKVNNTVERIL